MFPVLMYLPSDASSTISASFTSPLPVSVNIGIVIRSSVTAAFVEYVSDASNHVTVSPVKSEGI